MKLNPYSLKSAFLLAACLFTANTAGAVTVKYTNSGAFTPPAGITSVTVEIWGGGGAGGSAQKTAIPNSNAGGGGGGGGAYAKKLNVPVVPGTPYTITIPAGAVAPAANSGFANGDRVDGASVTFTNGDGVTVTANGGQGGESAVNTTGTLGAGGAASIDADVSFAGGNGATHTNGNAGAGGSGASDLGDGNSGASSVRGGTKAGSDLDHNGGQGGTGKTGSGDGNGGGNGPSQPGGGGGGAKASTTSTAFTGASGAKGQILISYDGGTVVKANNTQDLNLGASWVGGNPPNAASVAQWDNTVTSVNTTVLGDDLTWGGINILNPTGLVTINGSNTLTLTGPIDMSVATSNLTLNNDLILGGSAVWTIAATQTLTLGGVVSGNSNITLPATGKLILSGANTYSGTTAVNGGTLQLGASDVIPNGAGKGDLTMPAAATLDLNGFSETLNGLAGQGSVDNTAAGTTSTLTVGDNNVGSAFNGVISNSGVGSTTNLVKIGNGQFSLGNANTLKGSVTVTGGNLTVANANALDSISGLSIGGAQLGLASPTPTIVAPITLTGNLTAIIQSNGGLGSLNGAIGGTGNITFATGNNTLNGDNRVLIGAPGTFVGNVIITTTTSTPSNNMTVQLGALNALPATAVVTLDGQNGNNNSWSDLDLVGYNQTLAGLTNITRTGRLQRVYNSYFEPATLTINNADDYTFGGTLGKDGGNDFSLTKSGAGTFTLTGVNTYTGTTSVTAGALVLSGTAIPDTNSLSVTGTGTISVADGGTETVGSLTIGVTTYLSGAYTSANTGGVVTSGTIQVGAAAGYAAWQTANGTTQTIGMDHDNDGVSNGVEFFLLGPVDTTGFTALPGVVNTGGTRTITFTKAAGYGGVYGTDFVVETSSTLAIGSWTTQTLGDTVTIDGNDVKYTFAAGTKNFARLKVTGP